MNVQALIGRFKALIHYRDLYSEERMDWLKSRAAIVILDTYGKEQGVMRPNSFAKFFHASCEPDKTAIHRCPHLAFAPYTAQTWMRSVCGKEFFWFSLMHLGSGARHQSCTRIFDMSVLRPLRNLAVKQLAEVSNFLRCRARYAEAFRTVCVAAANTLHMKMETPNSFIHTGEEATKQLKYLGYRVLNIDEFLTQY